MCCLAATPLRFSLFRVPPSVGARIPLRHSPPSAKRRSEHSLEVQQRQLQTLQVFLKVKVVASEFFREAALQTRHRLKVNPITLDK